MTVLERVITRVFERKLVPLSNGVLLDVMVTRLEKDARTVPERITVALVERIPVTDGFPLTDTALLGELLSDNAALPEGTEVLEIDIVSRLLLVGKNVRDIEAVDEIVGERVSSTD